MFHSWFNRYFNLKKKEEGRKTFDETKRQRDKETAI